MRPRTGLHAATWVAAFWIVGCAHSLGPAPTDAQLANDGSEESRRYLEERYKLAVRGDEVHRPWSNDLYSEGNSGEVETYVARSDDARAALETLPVALHRWSGSVAMPITLLSAGASVGAGVGLFVGLMAIVPGEALLGGQALAAGQRVGEATLFGGAAGLAAAVPITLLTWWTLDAIAGHAARADYRRSSEAFNADLQRRIEAGYRPELVRPPSVDPSSPRRGVQPPIGEPPAEQKPGTPTGLDLDADDDTELVPATDADTEPAEAPSSDENASADP